jgi:2-polyprenyl-3-methyl-5-hydroxy-6-metoxy-1,4-benzoquinol methylase
MSEKFTDYYENARPEIQGIVGDAPKRILDVGCGAGTMAFQLKQKNNAEVWGIEPIASAAEKAKGRLDTVIASSVEDAIAQLPDYHFDTIIFADVLEHLVDPYSILSKIKYKLAPEGFVVTSLPNVRHWSVIKQLLEGRWDYQEYGIMDSTHLRFFTRSTVERLFEGAGFDIEAFFANNLDAGMLPPGFIEILTAGGLNVSTLEEESKHFQYLVKAYPATRKFRNARPEEVGPFINSLFSEIIQAVKAEQFQSAKDNCLLAIDIIHRTEFPELQALAPKFESLLLKLKSLKKSGLSD